jgi:Predicted phosphohydrolases
MNNTVTWLHISDTHFCREKHDIYSKTVFNLFFKDLENMKKKYNLYPDLIFFSGDLAYGCTESTFKSQYEEAKEFLEMIRSSFPELNNENIFIVPGNHDVNRNRILDAHTCWLNKLRSMGRMEGSLKINELIRQKNKDFLGCMQRLDDYQCFLQDSDYRYLLQDSACLSYSTIRNINGFNIGIVGLNSAWSSDGSDEDKGRLLLGSYQILESCNKIENTAFSVVISHHAPNYFVHNEDQLMNEDIRNNFEFYLHGHDHKGWVSLIDSNIRISSGALYSGFGQKYGYNFVRIYPDKNKGEVFLRTYNNGWIPDIIGNKTDNEGRCKLKGIFNKSNPNPKKVYENHSFEKIKKSINSVSSNSGKIANNSISNPGVRKSDRFESLDGVGNTKRQFEITKSMAKKVLIEFLNDWKSYSKSNQFWSNKDAEYMEFISIDNRLEYHLSQFILVSNEISAAGVLPEAISNKLINIAARIRVMIRQSDIISADAWGREYPSSLPNELDKILVDIKDMYENIDTNCSAI